MNLKFFLKNLAHTLDAPDSVSSLRRVIFDLAMRGKLVPQNPKEKSTFNLLKQIKEEKTKLAKAGKVKSAKSLPPFANSEKSFSIPASWGWMQLCDVTVDVQPGFASGARSESGTIQFRMHNVTKNGNTDWIKKTRIPATQKQVEKYAVSVGDVLFNNTNSAEMVGKTALFNGYDESIVYSNHFTRIKTNQMILSSGFLARYLQERRNSRFFELTCNRWIGQAAISRSKLLALHIPLPPLAEQKRIVAKVDALMSLCDKLEVVQQERDKARERFAVSVLDKLTSPTQNFEKSARFMMSHFTDIITRPEHVKELRRAIFNMAVRGKLVSQNPKDEPASKLLKQIKEEKIKLEKVGKIKPTKPLPPLADSEKPFSIPAGWKWVYLGDVAVHKAGKTLNKSKNTGVDKKYLRTVNVRWFNVDLSDLKEMPFEEHEMKEYAIKNGDVLILDGGEVGRTAIWNEGCKDIYYQNHIHRVRFLGNIVPFYFPYMIYIDFHSGKLSDYCSGMTIKNFSSGRLAKYIFPLPPLAEQKRIVAKVDALMSLCDQLELALADSRDNRRRLLNSLINTAA